jgi:hypothetical protein
MPKGFRGSNIQLESVELESSEGTPRLLVGARFVDDEGTVHAFVKHAFLLEEGTDLTQTVKLLNDLLIRRVEELHFDEVSSQATQVTHGILEAIRDASAEDSIRSG